MAKDILLSLSENEKIRIVTHSMGAAFAKGFLFAMVLRLGTSVLDIIEEELDVAPFEPSKQAAIIGITTRTMQHTDDGVAGYGKMKDAEQLEPTKVTEKKHTLKAHEIISFSDELRQYFKETREEMEAFRRRK